MSETVWLQRPSGDVPWGFRLQGGRDYQAPLSVQKVTQGSVAATGLSSGDVILRIGETDTSSLTYSQAMDVIKNCGNLLQLSVSKQGGLYSQASQVDSESGTTMASGALHDLFQDMYRYTDPATFPQEGALPSAPHKQPPQQNQPSYTYNPTSQSYQPSNPTSQTYQPSNPTSQTYQPSNPTNQTYQPSNPPSQTYQPSNPTYQPSRAQTNGTAYGGPNTFTDQNYGRGYQPQPAPGSFPPTAPPSYNDVQSNREQVTYPYQPTTAPAANPYGYPHSVSSSTSELSDISSGYGAYDTKPGSRQMASPGGGIKVYTSGSPADSSSGVGSYSCETPDQAETTYQATVRADVVRQDSFPLPPPPLHSEASYGADSQTDTYTAPEPAPAAVPDTAPPPAPPCVPPPPPPPPPPPAPPAPPLPSSTPGKSWKVKQNEDTNSQQSPPTRLEQQLSNMSIGGGSDYGRQNSFPAPPTPPTYAPPAPFSPSHPPGAPPAPHYGGQSPSVQPQRSGPAMPDAVLNMAAKGEPDKKPWAYAPDMASIKDQRDKVRKRAPAGGMPKYQQLLNLPQFDDSPIVQPQQPQQQQRTPTQTPGTPDYGTGPGQANVQHLQFNSPIGMYSEDNMAEAFAGQTDGVITGVRGGGNKNDKNDVTQSPVYRMIHGLDADKARSRQVAPQQQHQQPQQQQQLHPNQQQQYRQPEGKNTAQNGGPHHHHNQQQQASASHEPSSPQSRGPSVRHGVSFRVLQWLTETEEEEKNKDDEVINERPRRGPAPDDELTFSGLSARSEIPSKSFHRLQSMTGGSDVDTSSIRANVTGDVDNNQIGDYDQASIRYTGRNIPSKSFRMLQSMTGPEPPTQATQPTRQRRRPQPQPEPESNPDDIVDISYVGGNIPSRSFKVLQQAMGQPDHQAQAQQPAPFSSCDSQNTDQGQGQTRTVKVIKLRSSQPAAEPSGVTDF